jgi:hypothetical protein
MPARIWTQPFTRLPSTAADAAGTPSLRAESPFTAQVFEQVPPIAGAHP